MIELVTAKTKAQQIREYIAAHPNATPTEVAKVMEVNRQYVYTVMWKTKSAAGVKARKGAPLKRKGAKKLGRPRKVTEASENLKRLVEEYKASKATGKAEFKQLGLFSSNVSALKGVAALEPLKADPVNHPAHYKVGGIETIDFIEAKKLNYNIGNVVKYLTRADHKGNRKQDLEKAMWYLNREISALK
jgi:hypothetical protein